MRRRRTNKKNIPAQNSEPKKYTEPVLGITYKDEHDIVKDAVLPFGSDYDKRDSYKENFEAAYCAIYEDIGGFWLDDKIVIPAHRILKVYTIEKSTPQKPEPVKVKKAKSQKPKYIESKTKAPKKANVNKSNQRTNTDGGSKC